MIIAAKAKHCVTKSSPHLIHSIHVGGNDIEFVNEVGFFDRNVDNSLSFQVKYEM